jgi:surfeit locus 1 family protein
MSGETSGEISTAEAKRRLVIVAIATIVGVAATARLGAWQLSRAAEKIALQTALDTRGHLAPLSNADLAHEAGQADAQHYRPAVLRGQWVPGHTVFLENRQMNGRPGFFVVTPLRLDGRSDAVLVQRGWAPRDIRDRTLLPHIDEPAGTIEVHGLIAPPPSRLFEFSGAQGGAIRQNLDLAAFSAEIHLPLAPVSVQQNDSAATAGDALLRQWPHPAVDVHKHYGYAFQWFAMSALMAGLYVWFQLVRPRFRRVA